MNSMSFVIEGAVDTRITVTELDDGSLKVDVQVLDDTGQIGDLRALYFDLADDSLAGSLSVTGDDVTDSAFATGDVSTLGQDTNMKGEVIKEYGEFDAGVEFGTMGMAGDDIQSTSFILSSDLRDLTLDDILAQDFGIRLTSVGEVDGDRDDSLKLGDIAIPEPDAIDDDWLATSENLPLTGANVLINDSDILAVSAVNGDAGNVGTTLSVTSDGGRVGSLTIESDGSVIFDPLDSFFDLGDGETDIVTGTYQGTGGTGGYDTASFTITIYGMDDWGDFPLLG